MGLRICLTRMSHLRSLADVQKEDKMHTKNMLRFYEQFDKNNN